MDKLSWFVINRKKVGELRFSHYHVFQLIYPYRKLQPGNSPVAEYKLLVFEAFIYNTLTCVK
jgi:hypothetical protein